MKSYYLKILVIAAILSMACTTKVSEWVLMNSVADKYTLIYYHNGPIPASVTQQHYVLDKMTKTANLQFKTVLKEGNEKSHYGLYYQNRLIAEYADYNAVSNVAFSALREKVATELMAGKLCVMLFLKSGNREKDEATLQTIKKTVDTSPFGNIITVLELDRNSVEERHFVNLLLNVESDLKDINEPMLFGVFGRFRTLEPLLAKGISEENINLLINFLTADCSCLIKDDLPGMSILCDVSWENPQPAMVNNIIDANPNLEHN
jgi:hypothetical protein